MDERNRDIYSFTVRELIEILRGLPQDVPVLTSGYESGYDNFYQPFIKRLRRVPDNMYYDGEFQDAEERDPEAFEALILARVLRDD